MAMSMLKSAIGSEWVDFKSSTRLLSKRLNLVSPHASQIAILSDIGMFSGHIVHLSRRKSACSLKVSIAMTGG